MIKKFTAIYNDKTLIGVRRTEQIEWETVADMLTREGINDCTVFLFHGHPLMQGEEQEHEFVEDCDCQQCAIKQRDIAIRMLAEWVAAIHKKGTGWDDWDEYYKDADYRPCKIRHRLDKVIADLLSSTKRLDF